MTTNAVIPTKRTKRIQKAVEGPRALPVVPDAVARLEVALVAAEDAQKLLIRAGRDEDVFQLGRFVNDLRYRLLPRVNAVACSHCAGYRADPSPASRCRHE